MIHRRPLYAAFLLTFLFCITNFVSQSYADDMVLFDDEAESCGHEHASEILYAQHPELVQQMQEMVEQPVLTEMNLRSFGLYPELEEEETYVLPVVFHIFTPGGQTPLTDAAVLRGLDFLNEQYANIPTTSLPPGKGFYRPDGTNAKIQFALALQDPDGNPTTGINHYSVDFTSIPSYSPNAATQIAAWPGNDYINFWAVPSIAGNVVGFAYYPSGPSTQDHLGGVFFESHKLRTIYSLGGGVTEQTSGTRTIAHEIGHYLGLPHTFNGDKPIPGCTTGWCQTQPNTNCLMQGDRICDTPPDSWRGTTCPGGSTHNSATTDADDISPNNPFTQDVDDIHANVMDYGGNSCVNHITQNQKERMRATIGYARASLLVSPALQAPVVANCTYKAPILTLSPEEVKAASLNESGTVVATIKNNNVGSSCPETAFTLTQTISNNKVDAYITDKTVHLATQQTGTIEINYTLAMEENATAQLQFQAVQAGQPNKKATRGIVFQTNQVNHFTNAVVKQPGTNKTASTGEVAMSGSASVVDMFSAGGGCASQNSSFAFLLVLTLGFVGRIRFKKTLC